MKTIENIQTEINLLKSLHPDINEVSTEKNKDEKRVYFLRLCINYLEINKDEKLLKSQHDSVSKKIKIIKSRYDIWIKNNYPKAFEDDNLFKKAKRKYNAEFELSKLENQLKTVNFLLS